MSEIILVLVLVIILIIIVTHIKNNEMFETSVYYGNGIPLPYENRETVPIESPITRYRADYKCCPSQYGTSSSYGGCVCPRFPEI